jgi:hypothetical protein
MFFIHASLVAGAPAVAAATFHGIACRLAFHE